MGPPPTPAGGLETSPVARRANSCQHAFEDLVATLRQHRYESSEEKEVQDVHQRYLIWARNLACFYSITHRRSLDYRLRNAKSISRVVVQHLDDLLETLTDAIGIADGTRPDQSTTHPSAQAEGEEGSPIFESELQELFAILSDIVTDLFEIAVLIRRGTDTDRYAAAASNHGLILPDFDTARIGHVFPKLHEQRYQWLRDRLGHANARRRQFLSYASQRVERNTSSLQHEASTYADVASVSYAASSLRITTLPDSSITDALQVDDEADDATSFVSSVYSDDADEAAPQTERRRGVVPLEEVNRGRVQFECPYCHGFVSMKSRPQWKKHVFADLRAYVCTFEDCSVDLFEDRREWFAHEMTQHRTNWICQICQRSCTSHVQFMGHLRLAHREFTMGGDMLAAVVEASRQPVTEISASGCPLCDAWPGGAHVGARPNIDAFRRHLGDHMEQLALFVLPNDQNLECDSDQSESEGEAHDLERFSQLLRNVPLEAPDTSQSHLRDLWEPAVGLQPRHSKVSVLIFYWEPDDDDLGNLAELDKLATVLRTSYRWQVQHQEIAATGRSPQLQLFRILSNFVYEEDDESALLIVYYGGHGWTTALENRTLKLSGRFPSNEDEEHHLSIDWNEAERVLMNTAADILTIFDCCHAGLLCQPAWRGRLGTRAYQTLAACGANERTRAPGAHSFTTAITWAFAEMASRSAYNVNELLTMIIKAPGFPPDQNPQLYGSRFEPSMEYIQLAPMPAVAPPPSTHPYHNGDVTVIDARFFYERPISDEMLATIATAFKSGPENTWSKVTFIKKRFIADFTDEEAATEVEAYPRHEDDVGKKAYEFLDLRLRFHGDLNQPQFVALDESLRAPSQRGNPWIKIHFLRKSQDVEG